MKVLVFAAAFLAIRDVSGYSWALAFLVFVAVVNGLAATPTCGLRVHAGQSEVMTPTDSGWKPREDRGARGAEPGGDHLGAARCGSRS